MTIEHTLSIIKPDAVKRNLIGNITSYLEKASLQVVAARLIQLTKEQAESFYAVHSERPFFAGLVDTMTSGPVMILVLKGENAVLKNRQVMGATNPVNADAGTIRKDFALNIEENSVHGSDSLDNAKVEIDFFFSKNEIVA